jgi:hypothetical protein
MYQNAARPLYLDVFVCDPLTRMVMDADGVSLHELIRVLEAARDARSLRARPFVTCVARGPLAMNEPA